MRPSHALRHLGWASRYSPCISHAWSSSLGQPSVHGYSPVMHQSHISYVSVTHQLRISHASVTHQSRISHASVMHQSCVSHTSVMHQSRISHAAVMHQAHISHASVMHQSCLLLYGCHTVFVQSSYELCAAPAPHRLY